MAEETNDQVVFTKEMSEKLNSLINNLAQYEKKFSDLEQKAEKFITTERFNELETQIKTTNEQVGKNTEILAELKKQVDEKSEILQLVRSRIDAYQSRAFWLKLAGILSLVLTVFCSFAAAFILKMETLTDPAVKGDLSAGFTVVAGISVIVFLCIFAIQRNGLSRLYQGIESLEQLELELSNPQPGITGIRKKYSEIISKV
jgi:low affinity Fe/Cu permease